eukprot:9454097-Heterocapsa_arctica.AAC.1
MRVSNSQPHMTLAAILELQSDNYRFSWKFVSQDTFRLRTPGTPDLRELLEHFKTNHVYIHEEPHHKPMTATKNTKSDFIR